MRLRWRGVDAPTPTKHWQEWYETHIGAKWPPRARHKKQVKIGPAAPSTRISATSVRKFGPGAFQNRFWRGSGISQMPLGRLLGALGCLLGALGCLLNSSWASLGRSWATPGCHMLPKRGPGSILEGSRNVSVGFRRPHKLFFSMFFRTFRCNAFNNAVTTLLHFLALVLFPFWCGGLCAAHGIRRALVAPGVLDTSSDNPAGGLTCLSCL